MHPYKLALFIELEKTRRKYRQRKTDHLRKRWREAEARLSESYARDERARLEKEITGLENSSRCNNLKRTWQLENKLSERGEKKKLAKVKKLNGEDPATQEEFLKIRPYTSNLCLIDESSQLMKLPRHLESTCPYILTQRPNSGPQTSSYPFQRQAIYST